MKHASGICLTDVLDKSTSLSKEESLKIPVSIFVIEDVNVTFSNPVSENAKDLIFRKEFDCGKTIVRSALQSVKANSSMILMLVSDKSTFVSFVQYEKQLLFNAVM